MIFWHSNASLDHFLCSFETRNNASCHLLDKLEGGGRQVSPRGSVGVEGVVDQPLVQGVVLLVAQDGFLGNVLHDPESPSCASIPSRVLSLRQDLGLNLVHRKRHAQAAGHLLQSDNSCNLFDIGHALHEVVNLIAVDCTRRDNDLAARAFDIGDVHDLREAPIGRLLLVGVQVLPQSAPATGLPGLLLHSTSPVPVKIIPSSLKLEGDLFLLGEVLVVDVPDLRHVLNSVRPHHVAASSRGPLLVVEFGTLCQPLP